ncbi:TPA: group II truncated hemoglobin [Photobacterium damselae]
MDRSEYPEQDELSGVKKRAVPNYQDPKVCFTAAGKEPGITQLVASFYHFIDTCPEAKNIRAMHPDDLTITKEKLTTFLIGWLGGPQEYTEKYGSMNLPGAHRHFAIGIEEKQAWLNCMQKALDEQNYDELFKRHVMVQLSFPAEMCRNQS